ncbi:MAG: hypothetical protein A4E73_00441 [Syntrophaceae bacterium PtaU1.Bin231]|nr:MAG: hypothetical protein A4E73_00441 [Syntrophaceae bacterium PtaU1.Bin231]
MMKATEGGIRISVEPAAAVTLAAKDGGYPFLIMAPSMTPPTAAVQAGPEPEMPPITMATRIVMTARDPRPCPMMDAAKRSSRAATPDRSKMAPARTNIGTARSGYFAMPV